MEPIHSLSIASYSSSAASTLGGPVISYTITLKLSNGTTLQVLKRYSEFDAFHGALMSEVALREKTPSSLDAPPNPLPPKSLVLPWKTPDTVQIETRRRELEAYLTGILYCKDFRYRRTAAWLTFLQVPKELIPSSWDGQQNHVFNLVSTHAPTTPLPTFASWLDEYAKCQEFTRDIRGCLHERDRNAGSSSGQAIAASQVALTNGKKHLETLNAYISRLESSLKTQKDPNGRGWVQSWVEEQKDFLKRGLFVSASSEDLTAVGPDAKKNRASSVSSSPSKNKDAEVLAGNGEIQRRWDMLANLQKDRDLLAGSLAAPTAAVQSSFNSDRNALFSTSSKNTAGPSRRKFGVQPPQETDETRPLDNRQVLGLQEQLMSQQDEALEALSSVISRQKQIGIAINQELDQQNQLLEDLDGTLGRVQGNLKAGDKKLNRILKG